MHGRRWKRVTLGVALLGLAAAGLDAGSAAAVTLTVSNTNNAGEGSLRQAIADASPGDTIVVPASSSHYAVTSDQLTIAKNVTISGGGARGTVIDAGNGTHRVIEITAGTVSISDVTITGGNTNDSDDGGGIHLDTGATLTLSNAAVTGNTVDTNSWAGGGIFANTGSTLTINSSTIANNVARNGGGLYLNDGATITNSTISGNQAGDGLNVGDGGGLQNNSTALTLTNDTIANNESFDSGGGGGIYGGTTTVSNTIVANNTDSVLGVDNCATRPGHGTVTSAGPNLENGSDCAFAANGGIGSVAAGLGPLANNGGPTDTHALAATSPAIDHGLNSACPASDQRGGARPQPPGGTCDIGAYEYGSLADLAVSLTGTPNPVTLGGTLTYQLTVTNNGPDPGTGISLQDTPPGAATLVSSTASQGTCTGSGPVSCALGTLASGASATLTIALRPTQAGTAGNTASVSGDQTDPTPANNQAQLRTSVHAPAGQPPPVTQVPLLTNVAQSRRSWREGGQLVQISRAGKPPVGTTFSFALNVAARVRFAFTQSTSGRVVAGKCVRPTKHNARKRTCKRTITAGTLNFAAHRALNKVRFDGRLSSTKTLALGRYVPVITATNAAGHSRPKSLSFTIVK
ncbi:MAG: choice-of-anchor Q domain-containing protein [Solirubrobacteraceae bacterium]